MKLKYLSTDRIILFAGITILLVSFLFFIRSFQGGKQTTVKSKTSADKLLLQLDTAQPRFEIGYAQMNMSFYTENMNKLKSGDTGLFTYPVYRNVVANRIETNSPPVKPEYQKELAGKGFDKFIRLYKQNKLT